MKKIIYLMVFLWTAIIIGGCEKELKDYDGEEGVYFFVQYGALGDSTKWASHSSTTVEFMNVLGDSCDVTLRVMATGKVKDYDRTFRMVVDVDSTTAVEGLNFKPFDEMQVVKAGATYADVMIRLLRNDNIQKEQKVLGVRLVPSDDFTLAIPQWGELDDLWSSDWGNEFDASLHKIIMNDFLVRPARWIPSIDYQQGEREAGLWGAFPMKKYRLICDFFNLTYEDFATEETMPSAKRSVIKEYMVNYLQDLYDNGTPVLEEDGRLMWFMGVSWYSYVGVAWESGE